jgi:DNA repair photolyase
MELYGGSLSLKRDPGQRTAAGCACRLSTDVGSYDRHPCAHGCLYCYATPVRP